MEEQVRFVWVRGLRGPSPQIWYGQHGSSATGQVRPHLQAFNITKEEAEQLSIKELAEKYPCTVRGEEYG